MTPNDAPPPRPSERPEPEADPTGMHALLSSLPDPGPMPEDLVRRIEARLAVESHAAAGPTSRTRPADHLLDLAAERSRRRPARTVAILGVAAAGLLVTTVSLGQVVDGGMFGSRSAIDSAARYPAGGDDGSGGAPAADGGSEEAGSGEAGSDEAASPEARSDEDGAAMAGTAEGGGADSAAGTDDALAGSPLGDQADLALPDELVIVPALGEVTTGDYRERLEQVSADGPSDDEPSRLTWSQVAGCWSTTGSAHRWDSLHAAEAELSDDPVVVLLGRSGDRGEAFLMPWTCTTADGGRDDGAAPAPLPLDHTAWRQDR